MTTQVLGRSLSIKDDERSLPEDRVEAMWAVVCQDVMREIPSIKEPWDPGYIRKKLYTDEIWRAMGSPALGSTVTLDNPTIHSTMQAAHKPATDRAYELGLEDELKGRSELMYCNSATQRSMTRELIAAAGARVN